MKSAYENVSALCSGGATALDDDRRYNQRNKVLTRVHIRRADAPQDDKVGTTLDISRDGLYFVVRSGSYEIGNRLLISIPEAKSGWTCEVVRTEFLPNGGQGVGVLRLSGLIS